MAKPKPRMRANQRIVSRMAGPSRRSRSLRMVSRGNGALVPVGFGEAFLDGQGGVHAGEAVVELSAGRLGQG